MNIISAIIFGLVLYRIFVKKEPKEEQKVKETPIQLKEPIYTPPKEEPVVYTHYEPAPTEVPTQPQSNKDEIFQKAMIAGFLYAALKDKRR